MRVRFINGASPSSSQPRDSQAENQYLRDPLAAVLGDGKQARESANRKFD